MSAPAIDPRIERSRHAVLEATLGELAAVGYGALTIEGVARRANVGKATIYRHWDGKLDLVADAVTTLEPVVPAPACGELRERIVGFLHALAEHFADSRFSSCLPSLIEAGERDEGLREFHLRSAAARRAVVVVLLDSAVEAGHLEPHADTGLIAELLVGPIVLRRLMTDDPFPADDVERLAATVLDPHWRCAE